MDLRQMNRNKTAENLRTRSFLICSPRRKGVTNDQTKVDEMGEEFRTQRREKQIIRNFFSDSLRE